MREVALDFLGYYCVAHGDFTSQTSDVLLIGEFNLLLLGIVDILYAHQEVVLLFDRFLIEDLGESVGDHAADLVLYLSQQAGVLLPGLLDALVESLHSLVEILGQELKGFLFLQLLIDDTDVVLTPSA
jgi:hypothetical protein